MYETSIEHSKKITVYSGDVELKLDVGNKTVYSICQEYLYYNTDTISIPSDEELEITITVVRRIKSELKGELNERK